MLLENTPPKIIRGLSQFNRWSISFAKTVNQSKDPNSVEKGLADYIFFWFYIKDLIS